MKEVQLLSTVDDIVEGDVAACHHLVTLLKMELDALEAALVPALEAQWQPAPYVRTDDTGIKSQGGINRPTEDCALDGRRMALRAQVLRSERILRDTAVAVRGVRRGLERSLDRWESQG